MNVLPDAPYLAIPEVSSDRRDYVPIGWLEPPTIPSSLVRIIENANLPLFGLLASAMHMSWLRHVGGRLESRYSYSIGLVYNTFPTPPGGTRRSNRSNLRHGPCWMHAPPIRNQIWQISTTRTPCRRIYAKHIKN